MASERVYVFLVQRRAGKPERIVVWDTQDITVGRAPENDVVVDDPEMSRDHARFYKSDDGYTIQNLSTSNPSYVNNQQATNQILKNKDVVRLGETEYIFCRVTRNPVTLGMKVEYASQLKGFGPQMAAGDGEATILGLVDTVDGSDDFEVRPANEFGNDLQSVEAPKAPRNLDLELEKEGLDELDIPAKPAAQQASGAEAWSLDEKPASDTLSLHLEIQGLAGPLRASVEALLGKVIELPKLRIRIKSDDLG
jgi:pSer/pThr/pTyr-binding forkhead associated (FHA) protein